MVITVKLHRTVELLDLLSTKFIKSLFIQLLGASLLIILKLVSEGVTMLRDKLTHLFDIPLVLLTWCSFLHYFLGFVHWFHQTLWDQEHPNGKRSYLVNGSWMTTGTSLWTQFLQCLLLKIKQVKTFHLLQLLLTVAFYLIIKTLNLLHLRQIVFLEQLHHFQECQIYVSHYQQMIIVRIRNWYQKILRSALMFYPWLIIHLQWMLILINRIVLSFFQINFTISNWLSHRLR